MIDRNTALVVVDVQLAFEDSRWGKRNNASAEANVARLLEAWRSSDLPVVHVHHRNEEEGKLFSEGSLGARVKQEAAPRNGEQVFFKTVNSAFIGTDLEQALRAGSVTGLVVAGLTTDHCVSTSVRMAANLGFSVSIASDATATFDRIGPDGRLWAAQEMHDSALASLHEEFALVVDTARLVAGAEAARVSPPDD